MCDEVKEYTVSVGKEPGNKVDRRFPVLATSRDEAMTLAWKYYPVSVGGWYYCSGKSLTVVLTIDGTVLRELE